MIIVSRYTKCRAAISGDALPPLLCTTKSKKSQPDFCIIINPNVNDWEVRSRGLTICQKKNHHLSMSKSEPSVAVPEATFRVAVAVLSDCS
jgi:hypothetical protein